MSWDSPPIGDTQSDMSPSEPEWVTQVIDLKMTHRYCICREREVHVRGIVISTVLTMIGLIMLYKLLSQGLF